MSFGQVVFGTKFLSFIFLASADFAFFGTGVCAEEEYTEIKV